MSAPAPGTLPRLLAGLVGGRALTLEEHLAIHGAPPLGRAAPKAGELVALLEECALHGRGGAGYPTAAKIAAVGRTRRKPIVVVNAVEAEPVSQKDRVLLGQAPHLVLDGAQIAASALRASEVIVCSPASSEWVGAAATRAIAEREGRWPQAPVRVVPVPDSFVAGEETSIVQLLNGGPALPTLRPPYPFERGVARRPTLINNAETLAQVGLAVRHGIDWFRSIGTSQRPGSAIVTLSGAAGAPGVYEVAYGTPLRRLLADAGCDTGGLRALLLGGCGGTWVAASDALSATIDDESLRHLHASLGAGIIVALPRESCGVGETAALGAYLSRASARQCGPCTFGLEAIAQALASIRDGRADADELGRLRRWLREVQGRGACRHPDGAVRMISSALEVFASEFAHHFRHGPCDACARRQPPLSLGRHAPRGKRLAVGA